MGSIKIGRNCVVGSGAVIQPFVSLADDCEVEALTYVPPYTSVTTEGVALSGNTFTIGPRQTGDTVSCQPYFFTRAVFPLLEIALITAAWMLSNAVVPSVLPGDVWSTACWKWLSSYFAVFLGAGITLFVVSVLLKWSFLSSYLTDQVADLTFKNFFLFLEKSAFINWWHRAFGMHIGRDSTVLFTSTCSASQAHLVKIEENVCIFTSVLAPRSSPSIWTWIKGETESPYCSSFDIVVQNSVPMYVLSRVEEGVTLQDHCAVGSWTRVGSGQKVMAGETVLGNPGVHMKGEEPGLSSSRPEFERTYGAFFLHLLFLVFHMGLLSIESLTGFQIMLSFGSSWNVYLRILARLAFVLVWFTGILAGNLVAFKWLFMGQAQTFSEALLPLKYKDHRRLFIENAFIPAIPMLHALFAGLYFSEIFLAFLGCHLEIGTTYIDTICISCWDMDLITIKRGAVVDNGYLIAHNLSTSSLEAARVFVDKNSVLHPLAGLFVGSLGEGSMILPLSSVRGMHVGAGEVWTGSPARMVDTKSHNAAASPSPANMSSEFVVATPVARGSLVIEIEA